MGTTKTKTPNSKTKVNSLKGNGNKGSNVNGNSPRKSKGPAASAAGPFKPSQKPLQYYKCGGCEVTGLIDLGANISLISKSFAEKLGLPCRQL